MVVVHESPGIEVRLPLRSRDVPHIANRRGGGWPRARGIWASQSGGSGKAVHQLIVPLVERGYSPTAGGKTGEGESAVGVALGEREVLAIGVADAHVALRPIVGIARTAVVESFIRRPARSEEHTS